jgi:PST family polysaccharide transporter
MTNIQKRRLFLNFSSLSIIQASNFLLSVLVIPHVVRKIGADGFGIVAVAQVVMIYLAVFTDYGFDQTATREVAIEKNNADSNALSRIFSTVILARLIICFLCLGLLLVLLLAVPLFREHYSVYILGFSFVLAQALFINWLFMGMEKMQYVTISSLFGRIVFVLLSFIFIREKTDSSLFLFFMGLGNAIAALLSIFLAFRIYKLRFIMPGVKDVRDRLKNGWQIAFSNLSITTCQYSAVFILRIFTNDLLVGYYSIAEKIYFAMKLMVNVFFQVTYPQVCQLIQKGKGQVLVFMKKWYAPFLLLVVFCCVAVFIFSREILFIFIGHKYDAAAYFLRVFCLAVIIVCLNIPACLVLLADNHKKNYLRVFALGTVINLAGNILLAHYFQATGTVIAVVITELFITIALYWEVYRIYLSGRNKKLNQPLAVQDENQ